MKTKELRKSLVGLYNFFINHPKHVGRKDNPLVVVFQETKLISYATFKRVSPLDDWIQVSVEFAQDIFVKSNYAFQISSNGYVRGVATNRVFSWGFVKGNEIIMQVLNTVNEMTKVD